MDSFGLKLAIDLANVALTLAANKIGQEARLILEFRDSFHRLQSRLDYLYCYLEDADRNEGRQKESNLLDQKLLRDLESAALEAQDVIDLCVVKGLAPIASSSRPCPWASCFNDLLAACFGRVQSIDSIPATYEIAVQIKEMEKILDEIEKRARSFTTRANTNSISSNYEDLLKRAEVIYREDLAVDVIPKRRDIERLIDQYRVVAVVGMGGSGKTHLLQHVFESIKSRYKVSIWLPVSRTFTVEQLQLDVLAKLRKQLGLQASEDRRLVWKGESRCVLEAEIHDALKKLKYLIVFDDVWELQGKEKDYCPDVMQKLRLVGLPENDLRTVLISTRNHEVASQIGAHVYKMPLLSDEHSKELFFKHLLPHSQVEQLQLYGNVKVAIDTALKRCNCLPLAIITVAGLFKHQSPDKWANSVQYLPSSSSSAGSQQNVVTTVLMLSFNHLDYKVKPCFVMLGLFAEDEEIDAENLIGMWLAEGHIKSHEEGILMLKHLCNRCLLEMKKSEDYYFSYPKTVITIHDVVHELAVKLCKEYGGICEVSQYTEDVLQKDLLLREERISRISLSKAEIMCIPDTVAFPRSLHVLRLHHNYNFSEVPSESLAAAVALRTLDISGTDIAGLPKCIGNFLLLKYLDIRDCLIDKFPECLRNLKLLEYLYTNIEDDVPQWIGDLEQLAFFEAGLARWTKIDRIPKYLKSVNGLDIPVGSHDDDDDNNNNEGDDDDNNNNNEGDDDDNNNTEGDRRRQEEGPRRTRSWIGDSLSELTQLKVLDGLYIHGFKEGCIPPPNIVGLTLNTHHNNLTLPKEWECCLQRLEYLSMTKIPFPDEAHSFWNLSRLCLSKCRVYSKAISVIPGLQSLWLQGDHVCESFPEEYGSRGAFPKLRLLFISMFLELKKMPNIKDGAMPCLSELTLLDCPKLSKGDGWTQKVATLSRLSLDFINYDFKAKLEAAYNSIKVTEQSSSIREDRGQ